MDDQVNTSSLETPWKVGEPQGRPLMTSQSLGESGPKQLRTARGIRDLSSEDAVAR